MALKFVYQGETSVPVELEGLTPDWARDKSLNEIERFEALHGNRKVALAEMFRVTGDAADMTFEFEGSLSGVHWIGSKMSAGTINVAGNVSDWAGAEMHGGCIHVRGDAGHLVGSAYRGSTKGMTAGEIFIEGNAGNEIGLCMRRGMIAIRGSVGEFVGAGMIAGTILVFGDCGRRPGAGMRRGTLGLFGSNPPTLLPTFQFGTTIQPQFIPLMLRLLQSRGFQIDETLCSAEFDIYHGDMVELGRGEILLRH
jgi:formylmethanofuran dehydrogenase subunit C